MPRMSTAASPSAVAELLFSARAAVCGDDPCSLLADDVAGDFDVTCNSLCATRKTVGRHRLLKGSASVAGGETGGAESCAGADAGLAERALAPIEYFEALILTLPPDGGVCLGVVPQSAPWKTSVGAPNAGLGLLSTGHLVDSGVFTRLPEAVDLPLTAGDVIGVRLARGVDDGDGDTVVTFSINGAEVASLAAMLHAQPHVPGLSLRGVGTRVQMAFRSLDWRFPPDDLVVPSEPSSPLAASPLAAAPLRPSAQ
ncbi:uncharacterized protein AMSG_10814 [Thecamonas trahens ATCC 50062]|uniref:Uncharacterized protein n=1 Tax=Thecamonas trahens ATCC 50062 TaxID=461836 RepID=A0A0L0DSE9_THETB|nr:hypothetical protein AMSG_10814 [Thecamonas trahens ATCC 50062]KNC55195.1 hypothetical protein AMSG_10814 [Thecamonas trahens ATCC 50062]|eukprot:XP_013753246.1 hypothetical protein AMSG_10814 [Thecamonas trahens ATCC 50062]